MSTLVVDILLYISVAILLLAILWLVVRIKGESRNLLRQLQGLFNQFKIINRSSELVNSSHAPSDILNIITLEAAKILGNVAAGIFVIDDSGTLTVLSANEPFKKWVKDVSLTVLQTHGFLLDLKAKKTIEIKTPVEPIKLKSGIFLPVIVKGKVIGALALLSLDVPRIFYDSDKNYMRIFASQAAMVIENKSLVEKERIYKEELLGINSITELGLLTLNSEEVLEVLINKFTSITKSECAVIFMKISRTDEYTVKATCGFKSKKDSDLLKDNRDLSEAVFTSGKVSRMGKRVGLPLKTNNEVFGCLITYKEKVDERELAYYCNLAEKVSIIIERAKLNESTSIIINELSAISYIGNVILSSLKLDDVLNLISKSVCEMMDAKGSTLRLLNEKTQELELCVSYGLSSKCLNDANLKVFTNTEGQVVETHQIMAIENLENSRYEMSKQLLAEGIKSLVCVPLMAKNKVIGILTLYFRYKREFTENDRKILIIFTSHTAIAIENTRLFKNWKEMYINVIKSFATALDEKDNYTKGHSEEVLKYASQIAVEMDLNESDVELLQFSAILHDIGKIGIADSILNKPAKLTKEEYEIIKKHPVIGSNIIGNIQEFKEVAKIIEHHHEAYGGGGYPSGLKSDEIPLLSRIITVVDSFEAMTSDRPYRKGMDFEAAFKELEMHKHTQFDPDIVDVFVKVMNRKKNDKTNQ